VRVDRNRGKLATFIVAFIGGSAVLLTAALVALPGWLLGWGAAQIELSTWDEWFGAYPWWVGGALVLMLALGGLICAVQLANAQDWVRNRFSGRAWAKSDPAGLADAVEQMSIAAGITAPELMVLDVPTVNALALGTSRKRPVIAVTAGFLSELDADEQKAVVATLIARICAGDILFGTALAALMGPLKAIRETRQGAKTAGAAGCLGDSCTSGCSSGDGCSEVSGCADGASGCADFDSDVAGGCVGALVIALFLAFVIMVTYAAVVTAAWIVTLWGRALHRTSYEKADAEGMLLLKDPAPMLSALRKVVTSATEVGDGDPSYDGVFYAPTSGTTRIEPDERRRFERLREILGTDGLAAAPLE